MRTMTVWFVIFMLMVTGASAAAAPKDELEINLKALRPNAPVPSLVKGVKQEEKATLLLGLDDFLNDPGQWRYLRESDFDWLFGKQLQRYVEQYATPEAQKQFARQIEIQKTYRGLLDEFDKASAPGPFRTVCEKFRQIAQFDAQNDLKIDDYYWFFEWMTQPQRLYKIRLVRAYVTACVFDKPRRAEGAYGEQIVQQFYRSVPAIFASFSDPSAPGAGTRMDLTSFCGWEGQVYVSEHPHFFDVFTDEELANIMDAMKKFDIWTFKSSLYVDYLIRIRKQPEQKVFADFMRENKVESEDPEAVWPSAVRAVCLRAFRQMPELCQKYPKVLLRLKKYRDEERNDYCPSATLMQLRHFMKK